MLASILSKISPLASRAISTQPASLMVSREISTKANKTSKLKAKLKARQKKRRAQAASK